MSPVKIWRLWPAVLALAIAGSAACREKPAAAAGPSRLTGFHIDMNIAQFRGPYLKSELKALAAKGYNAIVWEVENNVRWETRPDEKPDPGEINRVLDRLLGPQNKSLNEANPSINAKLPMTQHNPGGGRVKALHPVIVPPGLNPSINIRLFEQKPVLPEWILERGMMSTDMMDWLELVMEEGYRILITGGTRTGKTTLLSALCNFLPPAWRIVKI